MVKSNNKYIITKAIYTNSAQKRKKEKAKKRAHFASALVAWMTKCLLFYAIDPSSSLPFAEFFLPFQIS